MATEPEILYVINDESRPRGAWCVTPDGRYLIQQVGRWEFQARDIRTGAFTGEVYHGEFASFLSWLVPSGDSMSIIHGSEDGDMWVQYIGPGADASDDPVRLPGFDCFDSVAASPDGKFVAIGEHYGDIYIHDLITGETIHEYRPFDSSVNTMQYHPDGTRLYFGSTDGVLRILDISTGNLIQQKQLHDDMILQVDLLPDGSRIVTGSDDGIVKVWNGATFELINTFENGAGMGDHLVSPLEGGTIMFSYWGGKITILKLDTGELLHEMEQPRLEHSGMLERKSFYIREAIHGKVVLAIDELGAVVAMKHPLFT